MTIASQIEDLRKSLPGCSLVAFGDAKTRLILRSSQSGKIRREHLDQLCDEASDCFSLMDVATNILEETDDYALSKEAIVMTGTEAKIFVRSGGGNADFLCMVCGLPIDASAIIGTAQITLNSIAEAK